MPWPMILRRGDLRDPDLDGVSVTITQVKPSPDMRYATVFCEPLGGKNAKTIVAALNRHKGFLRGEMGHLITHQIHAGASFCRRRIFRRSAEDRGPAEIAGGGARSVRSRQRRRPGLISDMARQKRANPCTAG